MYSVKHKSPTISGVYWFSFAVVVLLCFIHLRPIHPIHAHSSLSHLPG